MKHVGEDALHELEGLLVALRQVDGLQEKNRGVFYRGSRAFLHFHEDPSGLYADVRLGSAFERMRVTTSAERRALMTRARAAKHDRHGGRS